MIGKESTGVSNISCCIHVSATLVNFGTSIDHKTVNVTHNPKTFHIIDDDA